jgi:hypothetical protein
MPAQKAQNTQPQQTQPKKANNAKPKTANNGSNNQQPPPIPEHELKQNSGVSASMALQAAQKAWDLRQAANAAGDPDAREKILAKAINKEIEAESFGKAAKYTRSGAFQGLAAGAGLGVQPGVTLGKLTGALVGGVVSTVTGLLGGGIGSVYGAMNGPFWDLGEMASQGVRGVIGDFPNWKSTPSQQKALEKMVMQTKETQAPTKEELEQMKADAPDDMPQTWSQTTKDMTSWRPSMPSMPNMPSMPTGAALGLGGLGASLPSWGGGQKQQQTSGQPGQDTPNQNQRPKPSSRQSSKQAAPTPKEPSKPKEAPTPKEAPKVDNGESRPAPTSNKSSKPQAASSTQAKPESKPAATKPKAVSPKAASKPQVPTKAPTQAAKKPATSNTAKQTTLASGKENKPPAATETERKKPRKLAPKSGNAQPGQPSTPSQPSAPKKAPRKLEPRKTTA